MRKHSRLVAAFAATTLLLAACGGDDTNNNEDTESTEETTEETDEETDAEGDGDAAADLSGTSVSVYGAPTSIEADAMNSVIQEYFNEPTGSNAVYEGSDSFETEVQIRIDGGNPPDLALFPQPGAVIDQAAAGNAVALEDLGFDIADLEARFGEYLIGLGEYEGKHYGIPTNANYKSLVWYNIPVFEAEGYEIPETYEDLVSLSEQMVSDGYTPWSIGSGSDAATGWPATDFLEDIVLRQAGPDTYDQWVSHEIPFDDPAIVEAMDSFGQIVNGEGFVLGGASAIPDVDFREAPAAIIGDEPAALMMRQASFITNFFPEGAEYDTDYGVFPFPSIDGNDGALIAGELGAVFRDAPEVLEFVEIYTGQEVQCAQGSFEGVSRISPNIEVTGECYDDAIVAQSADDITTALSEGTARFDASDLMPPEVGSGSFWTAMNEWMRGADAGEVLTQVESGWPA